MHDEPATHWIQQRSTVEGLAAVDLEVWAELSERILRRRRGHAPVLTIDLMLELQPDPAAWLHLAYRGLKDHYADRGAEDTFRSWFGAGLRQASRASASDLCAVRLHRFRRASDLPYDAAGMRQLVRDCAAAWGVSAELGTVSLLASVRAGECQEAETGLWAADVALATAKSLGSTDMVAFAVRLRGAHLIRAGELLRGLQAVRAGMSHSAGWDDFEDIATVFGGPDQGPRQEALDGLARVAAWAPREHPAWAAAAAIAAAAVDGPEADALWEEVRLAVGCMRGRADGEMRVQAVRRQLGGSGVRGLKRRFDRKIARRAPAASDDPTLDAIELPVRDVSGAVGELPPVEEVVQRGWAVLIAEGWKTDAGPPRVGPWYTRLPLRSEELRRVLERDPPRSLGALSTRTWAGWEGLTPLHRIELGYATSVLQQDGLGSADSRRPIDPRYLQPIATLQLPSDVRARLARTSPTVAELVTRTERECLLSGGLDGAELRALKRTLGERGLHLGMRWVELEEGSG